MGTKGFVQTHRTWIDDRLYPANNPVSDLVERSVALILDLCPGPMSTIVTSDLGLLKRERK